MLHLIKGTGKRISADFHHSGRLVVDFIHYSNSKFTTKLIWDLGFHEEYKGICLEEIFLPSVYLQLRREKTVRQIFHEGFGSFFSVGSKSSVVQLDPVGVKGQLQRIGG